MQIRQKASAMTDKKPMLFNQALPSRFISFSKIQKKLSYPYENNQAGNSVSQKITFLHIVPKSGQSTKRIKMQ